MFQRITENANAAMLHFQSPIYPELAVQSFMTYLHSFRLESSQLDILLTIGCQ